MKKSKSTDSFLDIVESWKDDFEKLWNHVRSCFPRKDICKRAKNYVRGLLGCRERKNGWRLAEYIGYLAPYGIQNLLGRSKWNANTVRDELLRYSREYLLEPGEQGILVIDETGFLKKGQFSVGVQRQYSGTAGRIENCQIGVFLALSGNKGRALIDRELYLPKSWCDDRERCRAVYVPDDVEFFTKPSLAQTMLSRAFAAGFSPQWVLADSVYGSDSKFRRFLEDRGQTYVLAVSSQQRLWVDLQQKRVDSLVKTLPKKAWFRLSVGNGQKGPRFYDWAASQIGEPTDKGFQHWVLFRRSVSRSEEYAYYLCLAPISVIAEDLAKAAGRRWSIECCFETAKQETGLDEYEVRSWHGWYRHVTLSMLALNFLSIIRQKEEAVHPDEDSDKKGGLSLLN